MLKYKTLQLFSVNLMVQNPNTFVEDVRLLLVYSLNYDPLHLRI